MVLAMHAGFAFLELGTVRYKNQVNALVKILVDFAVSTIAWFFIGYTLGYGTGFLVGAETLAEKSGYELVRFFFLLTFAAAIPAIVSGGIAEQGRFGPQLVATFFLVAGVYPLFEGIAWNGRFGVQEAIKGVFGEAFHDFAGPVVVHAVGGWVGLVAVNSLMAMVGGTLGAVALGRNDPGFAYNGPLAGLVAVCAGSDAMHPVGALAVGLVAGVLFVRLFTLRQNR
jgi:Amt family ammonium transporter